jgi:hypothetical protein
MGNACCADNAKTDEDSNFKALSPENPNRQELEGAPETIPVEDPNRHKPSSPIQETSQDAPINPSVQQKLNTLLRQPNTAPSSTSHFPHLGPYKYPDGSTYTGQYNQGKREGFGKQINADGSVYEGCWVNDVHCGNGRLVMVNGAVYSGEWQNNQFHGEGGLEMPDGSGYKGSWAQGKITGKGRQRMADGNIYQGDFLMGKKHGNGNYIWANGDKYGGQFKNDVRDGFGKFEW